jgi:hypothetical protein
MKAFKEITEWSTEFAVPNHVYFLSDSKDKMYGYVTRETGEVKEMSTPYRFHIRGRQFVEVPNRWAFSPKVESVPVGETHRVLGSKGAVYTVTNDRGAWTCTCPASKWQAGECKHIQALKIKS